MRTSLSTAVLAASGLVVTGVATAAPLSANETMSAKLHKLRDCESGNHFHINTGNGYYGAYQFDTRTWHGLGFHGRPDQAKAKTQNAAARKLHGQRGWHPWPSCSRKENL